MNASFSKLAAVAFYLCTSVLTATSHADTIPPRELVKYDDLRLDHPEDVVALYGRLRAAADRVCLSGESDWIRQYAASWCVSETIRRAISRISSPPLTQYYQTQMDLNR
jgi:UrcA family protein